jgi:RHS repeat-associated protein
MTGALSADRRLGLKALAMLAALLSISMTLSPMVQADQDSPPPPVPDSAVATPQSETAPPLNGTTDSQGGDSPPPGTVSSVYQPLPPLQASVPASVLPPRLTVTDSEYAYETVAGHYSFPIATPYLVQYSTAEGDLLVNASTFLVLAPGIALFDSAVVMNATDYLYKVQYGFRLGLIISGNITITYEFRDDAPPKATAERNQSGGPSLPLIWSVFTVDDVAFNGTMTLDFDPLPLPANLSAPVRSVTVGQDPDPANWSHSVNLDWNDTTEGVAFAGPLVAGPLHGHAAFVVFPSDLSIVDPVLAGTSTVVTGTDYSLQRKTFEYGNRFWAFWYDGSNIAYATSANGTGWSAKMTAPSGSILSSTLYTGFDVDQRDGKVLVGYMKSSSPGGPRVLVGSISESVITWTGPHTIWGDLNYLQAGLPAVAIGTDGYYWFAGTWKNVGGLLFNYVYRSNGPWATTFTLMVSEQPSPAGVPEDWVVRVVPLSNGRVFYLKSMRDISGTPTDLSQTVATRWYGEWNWTSSKLWKDVIFLPAGSYKTGLLTAVGDLQDRVHLFYTYPSVTGVSHKVLFVDDSLPESESLDNAVIPASPSASRDANGQLHLFYRYTDGSGKSCVRYARQFPGWDSPALGQFASPVEPFGCSLAPRTALSTAPLGVNYLFLEWTEGSANPYSIMFGAVPTPLSLGTQMGDPWNRQGISPGESYLRLGNEFVSPGSGLLTVKQTDLQIPGRGLDLEISRVFVTPRAFATLPGSSSPSPYLYEDYSLANLGKGWGLNLPWISPQYVHLWDGQMYAIHRTNGVFENRVGEQFVLKSVGSPPCTACFILYTKGGIRYEFDQNGRLTAIRDSSGNAITVSYNANGWIDRTLDTIGRKVQFYYANGLLSSIVSDSQNISYRYQTIGGSSVLSNVTDAIGRRIEFSYGDSRSSYLLTSVRYPAGSRSVYTWSNPAPRVGPDLISYYVTKQDNQNLTGASVRANTFEYAVEDGKVASVKVATWDVGAFIGCTFQSLDSSSGKSTTVRQAAPCLQSNPTAQFGKEVTWFDRTGTVGQVDSYAGSSSLPSPAKFMGYDEWGNAIYAYDGIGHEKFASHVNTRYQGAFYAPGRLTRTTNGSLFFDDFEDRDLSDWTLDATTGTPTLNYTIFESAPPSLRVAHNGGATGISSATHIFTSQPSSFVAEATVRAEETNRNHYVLLRSPTAIRVYVALNDQGYIAWTTGSTWNNIVTYQAGQWYRIGFQVYTTSNTYDIWVNGQLVKSGASLAGSGNIDRIALQASCSGCGSGTMYVDMVKVYTSLSLTITGLQAGQIVRFENLQGQSLKAGQVASGSTSLSFAFSPSVLPFGTIRIFDRSWTTQFASPAHEFWGGDAWAYTKPWWNASLLRTRSGFLRTQNIYVNGSLPTGAVAVGAEDGWSWGAFDYPVAGATNHKSLYRTLKHEHYFRDATQTLSISGNQYLIQYVFIPENQYPSEIMLQFRDTTNSWEHRAYWGANAINGSGWGTDGTASRRAMGPLPGPPGRWLMLVVNATDVGMNGKALEGVNYTLYGGLADWDLTAVGDQDTGKIKIAGLAANWNAALYDAKGNPLRNGTVPSGGSVAAIDLCNTVTRICAFPLDGYVVLKDASGASVYRSPVLSLWGGDSFAYGATSFYPNVGVDPDIHDLAAGRLEYQTGRGAQTLVPQEAYARYKPQGLPDRTRVRDGSVWRETAYDYDGTYGQLTCISDPMPTTGCNSYSETYSMAYITRISDLYIRSQYAYDPTTGWLIAERDGRGYMSQYSYDSVGRNTAASRYDIPPASETLYFDMSWTTLESPPRMEDLSGKGSHGTISGPIPAPGKVGVARAFDGVDDVITVPAASTLNTAAFTAALWFNRDTFTTSQGLLGKASFPNSWRIWTRTDAKIEVDAKNDAIGNLVSQTTVVAGRWYHVALTFDGTTARLYVNGVHEASAATGDWGGAYNVALWIGDTDSTSPFDGTIDEVRLFNVALNETNIGALFTNAYGRLSSSSIAYDDIGNVVTAYEPTTKPRTLHYDMETLLGGRMEDLSGHGGSGTLFGTANANGRIGFARSFGGNGDRIQGPNLDVGTTFSVGLWVNPTSGQIDSEGVLVKKDYTFSITLTSGRIVNAYIYNGATWQLVASNATLPAGTWTHVAVTYAASRGNTATYLYLNGAKDNARTLTGLAAASSNPVMFGALTSTFQRLKGAEDEVQLFDRALSAAEVSQLSLGTEKGSYGKQYFDSLGRVTRAVRRDLFGTLTSWETYTYNFRDQVVTRTVARNSSATFTTTYAYDFLGRPTSVLSPGTAPAVTISYDDVNRIRTVVAENGRKVQYVGDLGGRTTSVREYYDATNYYTTSYAYDEAGNLLSVTNALNQVTQHQYDKLNRLTKTIYPDPLKYETYTYDEVGNLRTKTDRAGQVTTYTYEGIFRHRLLSVDYSSTTASPDVSYAYDLSDNPTSVSSSPTGPTIAYAYDGLNRMTSETDTISGQSYSVGNTYDPAGRLTQLVYPDNTAISYQYDAFGRTSVVQDATRTYGAFGYSADDLTTVSALGNGINESYAYNGRGWPTSIKATSGPTTYLDLGYTFDYSGNILTMGSASYTYDKLDRLKTASGGFGYYDYVYDPVGNRLSVSTYILRPNAAGSSTQWTRVGSCSANWQCVDESTSDGSASYVATGTNGYQDLYGLPDLTGTGSIESVTVSALASGELDDSGCQNPPPCNIIRAKVQLLVRTGGTVYPGGATIVDTGTLDSPVSVSSTWTTNPATGQAWTVADVNALQAGVSKYSGLATEVTQLYVTVRFQGAAGYTYANGATGMNTLTSMTRGGVTTSYAYDANGNLDTKTGGWDYDWNAENLMTTAKLSGGQQQAYTYDGLGRRLNVTGATPSMWTVSIFSGPDVFFEKNNTGAITKYVYANGIRIAKIPTSGPVHYFLGDHLGSTRKILDSARTELYSVDYEPFGKPYSTSGSQPDPHRFTMEKQDDATGLLYLRARQYDPDIGRFVSADPVLGSPSRPQSLNRYSYVSNNPLTRSDPSGEYECGYLGEACERWWRYFGYWDAVAQDPWFVPDFLMTIVGFIPVLDTVSDVYFLARDLYIGFTTGQWDALQLGLDVGAVGAIGFGIGVTRLPRLANRIDMIGEFRPSKERYFRHNLGVLRGVNPGDGFHAHHVFPQKFKRQFHRAGLNIHEPWFGTWLESGKHLDISAEYNRAWARFFDVPGQRSAREILEKGQELARRYNFDVHFYV